MLNSHHGVSRRSLFNTNGLVTADQSLTTIYIYGVVADQSLTAMVLDIGI